MYAFKLPDLGEGVHEAEILKWYVGPSDTIREDDPLVDVETDKASVTIPSPKSGQIVRIEGKVGDTVTVGQVIVEIDDGEATIEPSRPATHKTPELSQDRVEASADQASLGARKRPVAAAPATRRLARELGVDINLVPASGPAGRVTGKDVRSFVNTAPGDPQEPTKPDRASDTLSPRRPQDLSQSAEGGLQIPFFKIEPLGDFSKEGPIEIEPLRSIRRKVARKMVTSALLAAHVAHMDEADVTDLEVFRKKYNQEHQERVTLLAFVIKAVTAGLKAAPAFNASVDPWKEEIVYKKYYNIAIAVDTGKGLVVPVVKNTDCKSLLQVARDINDLAGRAREDTLVVGDLKGSTFTISNVGPFGGTALVPIINYPEVAILGMGRVQEKPVVRDGQIVVRKMLPMTLSFDHRVADGADAARFVSALGRSLADPDQLLLST